MNQQEIAMPPPRKWTRTEELAVLHLYRGKVLPESREALALAEALERTPRSIAARMLGLASLDPANPKTPASKATALTRSLWAGIYVRPHRHRFRGPARLPWHPESLFDGPAVTRLPG